MPAPVVALPNGARLRNISIQIEVSTKIMAERFVMVDGVEGWNPCASQEGFLPTPPSRAVKVFAVTCSDVRNLPTPKLPFSSSSFAPKVA